MNTKSSTIIEIKRRSNLAHQDAKVLELYQSKAKVSIGSYFMRDSKKTATGLSFEEIDFLMPYLIDNSSSDREFRKEVTAYFDAIDTKIPAEGLKLEIGLKDNSKPLGVNLAGKDEPVKLNTPLNIEDYVVYKHAIGHPIVATSFEDAQGNYHKTLYVVDKKKQQDKADSSRKIADKALALYLANSEDTPKMKQVLIYLGITLRDIKTGQAKDVNTEFKKASINSPVGFIKALEDEDLTYIAYINSFVAKKVLRREGNRFIFENENLGNSEKDFVEYLKESKNEGTFEILKARLKELS